MSNSFVSVPRVESGAPNKNTIEWEIPVEVSVVLMRVEHIGYTVLLKIKVPKKHWWDRSWKTFSEVDNDPAKAIINALDILEKHGYTIDHNTVQFGEKIGTFF